jgi:polyphosphate kinase
LSMVVRDDGDQLRRYVHVGTGNYHPKTARLYEDLGLLTTDPEVGEDVANLFNQLSGYAMVETHRRLLVAPQTLRSGLIERIDREIENHLAGKNARIRFKCNALVDEATITALYRASQVGVPVDINVRGICTLRPGVAGLSENIRVVSILGRFLEHSRVFEFANDGARETWIGSADLMHRNLDRRVEVLVRLVAPEHIAEIASFLDLAFAPTTSAWDLDDAGRWHRRNLDDAGQLLADYQSTLIRIKQRRP